MDIGLLLSVFGLVLTVVFGALGIYLAIRHKYPGSLAVIVEDAIPLFEAIVESVPDLSVIYRGEAVSPGLVLLKIVLVNDGGIDIAPSTVEEPVSLVLPFDYHWLDARVATASPKVQAVVHISEDRVVVDFGLFRRDESIRFDAIVSAPPSGDKSELDNQKQTLRERLRLSHRIANVRPIALRESPQWSFVSVVFHGATATLGCGLLMLLTLPIFERFQPETRLELLAIRNGHASWVVADADANQMVLWDPNTRNRVRVDPRSVQIRGARVHPARLKTNDLIVFGSVALGVPLFVLLVLCIPFIRERRMQRLLGKQP